MTKRIPLTDKLYSRLERHLADSMPAFPSAHREFQGHFEEVTKELEAIRKKSATMLSLIRKFNARHKLFKKEGNGNFRANKSYVYTLVSRSLRGFHSIQLKRLK